MFIEVHDYISAGGKGRIAFNVDAIASVHEESETPMMTITYAVIRLRDGDEIQTADEYRDVVAQLRDLGVMKAPAETSSPSTEAGAT